jgi:hypothetical protein
MKAPKNRNHQHYPKCKYCGDEADLMTLDGELRCGCCDYEKSGKGIPIYYDSPPAPTTNLTPRQKAKVVG